ncbi:unnamed protein product [Arabidopsis halleri]
MFAFGFASFNVNSPMQFQHARCTLIFGMFIGFSGLKFGEFCINPLLPSFLWIYLHGKALGMVNGFYI